MVRLGDYVNVNEKSDYHGDYRGETWRVVGMALEPHGRINVTISSGVGMGRWDNPTDGFRPDELTVVEG